MQTLLNIYICIIAPLLLTILIGKGEHRIYSIFLVIGMSACVAAGYLHEYMERLTDYTPVQFTYYISPIYEELLKSASILVFVLIFKPERKIIISSAVTVGIGFATLENVYYIMQFGAGNLMFLLIRGFSTAVMHSLCTATVGYGLAFVFKQNKMAFTGTFGLLCGVITFHATYNLLVTTKGFVQTIGISLPVATLMAYLIIIYFQIISNTLKSLFKTAFRLTSHKSNGSDM